MFTDTKNICAHQKIVNTDIKKTMPFKINDLQTKKCLNVYTVTHMYRMMFKQLTPKLKFQYGR